LPVLLTRGCNQMSDVPAFPFYPDGAMNPSQPFAGTDCGLLNQRSALRKRCRGTLFSAAPGLGRKTSCRDLAGWQRFLKFIKSRQQYRLSIEPELFQLLQFFQIWKSRVVKDLAWDRK